GGRRFIRALGAEAHGNVPGGEVDDGGGNEERGNLARSAREERGMFALDDVEGSKVANLGGDLAGKGRGVEPGNASDATFAREQGLPHRAGGMAHGADQADAGDDDPTRQIESPPFLRLRM